MTTRIKWPELIWETLKKKKIAFVSSPDVLCWGKNEFEGFCEKHKIKIKEDWGRDGYVLQLKRENDN